MGFNFFPNRYDYYCHNHKRNFLNFLKLFLVSLLDLFLSKVMPEMIVSPKEFKTVNVLDEDFTAKQLLAAALIEIETKKLKSQQKRKTLRITEN